MRHDPVVTADRIAEHLDTFDEVIDVRSPGEFALDHLPGAVNCPVLNDEERALVGTLYKQVSQFQARKVGGALVAKNVARHLEGHFTARDHSYKPLIYCWRGGKRSGSMAHVLREVGWHAATLAGGYQAYRREVLAQLDTLPLALEFRVLCGPTGSAKSRVLEAASDRVQVLDLEALARHRGSVLGDLPGNPQPTQKMFDSLVWDALRRFDPARPVLVEAESRRIGALRVPEALLARMRASPCVSIDAPLPERVDFLIREYRHLLAEPSWLKTQLARLTALHSGQTVSLWMEQIDAEEWGPLVAGLLEAHYDPAYRKSASGNYAELKRGAVLRAPRLDAAGVTEVAAALVELLRDSQGARAAI